MLAWIKNLIKNNNTETLKWKTDSSIYNFLKSNLDADGSLKDSSNDLPDEKVINENQVRFAPGLTDSIFGSLENEASANKTNNLVQLIVDIAKHGNETDKSKFFKIVTESDAIIGIVDEFLAKLINVSPPVDPYLLNFSKDLAFRTSNRNSVKIGIALIGICGDKSSIDKIKLIGLHDEFTLFTIVALLNLSDNKVNDLWEMAKKVDGWGKIHTVERLTNMELPSSIKEWLVTDGYRNSIMFEYLAYTCATNGDLHDKIINATISNKLFKSSGEIIDALITGGPSEDIYDYQYASILIESYIRHAHTHASNIFDFNTLNQIKDFLNELQTDISDHVKNGWTEDIISNCLIDIVAILSKGHWNELAAAALQSEDNVIFWNGKKAAKALGIDIWDIVLTKLKDKPTESSRWHDVVHEAKPNNADDVLKLVEDIIPLNQISTGPRDSLGLGPEFKWHWCLDYVITFLEEHPTRGESILLAALWSPMRRNRNMAIKVLYKWGRENWSDNLRTKLQQLKKVEPNKDIKEDILRLLSGELSY